MSSSPQRNKPHACVSTHEHALLSRERRLYSLGSMEGLMETDQRQAAQRRHATLFQGDALAAWCARWLGAPPTSVLFEVAHLSIVTGLRLADGREVVIKARPPAARLQACVHVQRHLWAAGFLCPEPLAGPHPLGTLTATAEALVPGGTRLAPGGDSPRLFAEALAELVRLAPPVTALPTLAQPPCIGLLGL
jgi:hypothetical protein